MVNDQVFCIRAGEFQCIVNGKVYGTWATKEIAQAGMEVEQRRHARRQAQQIFVDIDRKAWQQNDRARLMAQIEGRVFSAHTLTQADPHAYLDSIIEHQRRFSPLAGLSDGDRALICSVTEQDEIEWSAR